MIFAFFITAFCDLMETRLNSIKHCSIMIEIWIFYITAFCDFVQRRFQIPENQTFFDQDWYLYFKGGVFTLKSIVLRLPQSKTNYVGGGSLFYQIIPIISDTLLTGMLIPTAHRQHLVFTIQKHWTVEYWHIVLYVNTECSKDKF